MRIISILFGSPGSMNHDFLQKQNMLRMIMFSVCAKFLSLKDLNNLRCLTFSLINILKLALSKEFINFSNRIKAFFKLFFSSNIILTDYRRLKPFTQPYLFEYLKFLFLFNLCFVNK